MRISWWVKLSISNAITYKLNYLPDLLVGNCVIMIQITLAQVGSNLVAFNSLNVGTKP